MNEQIISQTKVCNKCGRELNVDSFGKSKKYKDGLLSYCKECNNAYKRLWANNKKERLRQEKELTKEVIPEGFKKCSKCNQILSKDNFYKHRSHSDGLYSSCIFCEKALHNKTKTEKEQLPEGHKRCSKCKEIKKLEEFDNRKGTNDGKRADCKQCRKLVSDKWRERNREQVLAKGRLYYREHKEDKQQYDIEYRKNHKKQIVSRQAKWCREKRATDMIYKLKSQVRCNIRDAFIKKGFIKSSQTEQIVGCSILELVKYLMQTYYNNYGEEYVGQPVHIDHIKCLANATTEQEVYDLCHYTNLQLLKPEDNLAKSNKLDWSLPTKQGSD